MKKVEYTGGGEVFTHFGVFKKDMVIEMDDDIAKGFLENAGFRITAKKATHRLSARGLETAEEIEQKKEKEKKEK